MKAFYKVPHNNLEHKLKIYGSKNLTISKITQLFSNRREVARVDEETSTPKDVLVTRHN